MARMDDILLKVGAMPWKALGDGAYFKLLRYSAETGAWTIMLRVDKGGVLKSHYHLGAGEFLMTKGRMHYADGKVAEVGDYGYEALEAVHPDTEALEDFEMIFIGYGPLCYKDEEGKVDFVLDGATWQKLSDGEAQISLTQ